jgi:hypothetical protein
MTLRCLQFCLLLSGVAMAQAPKPAVTDVLYLATGAAVPCRVVTTTDASVKIEYRAPNGVTTLTREVPWADVGRIDFAMDEEFRTLLKATSAEKDGAKLSTRWTALMPMLGRPNHPAGDLGLVLATVSLTSPNPGVREQALTVCRNIESTDWSIPRRQQARMLRMRLLASLQRTEEAVAEARLILADPAQEASITVPTTLFLAHREFDALKKLQEENPVWEEDDIVRPDRERLFHAALDGFLKPSLFHGTQEDNAAAGLWAAVELLQFDRNLSAAADNARDLIKLYPAAPQAAKAQALLKEHNLPLEPAPEAADMAGAKKPDEPAPAEAAEPEVTRRKRYEKPAKK